MARSAWAEPSSPPPMPRSSALPATAIHRATAHEGHCCMSSTTLPRTRAIANNSMPQRVLALAGLIQALAQVRRIADTGQANAAVLTTALDSVFRIAAATPGAVYRG